MTGLKRMAVWALGAMTGAIALCALPGVALAQFSPEDGPVNASGVHAHMETDKATGYETMYYDDQVELLQTGRRLHCDHAKLIQAPFTDPVTGVTSKQIIQMEATGNVFYIVTDPQAPGEDQIVHGDYGIYTKSDDMLKVTGNVIFRRGKSVASGNLFTDKVHDGRVRAVMYPADNSKKPGAPAAAPAPAPAATPVAHP
jgi:lipopolysaccharide export system protein LptA